MKYVIIGAGVAGVEAAKTIRMQDPSGEIQMLSTDTHIHSRCMLHKYLGHQRDAQGINFVDADFFEKNDIFVVQ